MEDKIWIVKSSYKVLGPYTHKEVCELFKSKKISILDEVRSPETRWGSAREKIEFIDFIKQLKNQDQFSDATMTQSMAETKSMLTKTDQIPFRDDMTTTPYVPSMESNSNIQEASVVSETHRSTPVAPSAIKSFGSLNDAKVQQKIQKESHNFKLFSSPLIIAVVVGYMGLEVMRSGLENRQYEKNLNEALRLKNQKLYSKSMKFYEKATSFKIPDEEFQFKMSFLNLALKGGTTEQRRLYDLMINRPGLSSDIQHEAMLARALTYMYDGDLKRALTELEKLIVLDINYPEAKLNRAIASFFEKKYKQAYEQFLDLEKTQSFGTIVNYGKLLVSAELAKVNVNMIQQGDILSSVRVSNKKYLLRPMLLIQAYLSYLVGDQVQMDYFVKSFLSEPMEISKKFAHPLEVYWNFFDIKLLHSYCKEVVALGGSKSVYLALHAQCTYEVGEEQRAEDLLKDYLQRYPVEPNLKLTQAQFLMSRNENTRAEALLASIPESMDLKDLLKKELCLKSNDFSCLGKLISGGIEDLSKGPYHAYYLATYYLKNNNKTQAYEAAERSLEVEENFIPLLMIRNELEELK